MPASDNRNQKLGYALSLGLLVILLFIWQMATQRAASGPSTGILSASERTQLQREHTMDDRTMLYFESAGLTFAQIEQIAGLGLSVDDIEMSGGIRAFGITPEGAPGKKDGGFPTPTQVGKGIWKAISNPFYDKGPNDKGIGIQLLHSLRRVAIGFAIAIAVALPLGFALGMSPLLNTALMPYIQILKPISPLAWMPLALYTIKDAEQSSLFVIFICSIWPMMINTSFGVASVKKDWINIGRTLELSRWRMALTIILPAAAPTIFTGMRIAIGIAWLVIVAAEMLIGGIGMGYLVWNEWNGLRLDNMIVAVLTVGVVGLLLDNLIATLLKAVKYQE
jgi:nitrate/nitrite transport system permease protein